MKTNSPFSRPSLAGFLAGLALLASTCGPVMTTAGGADAMTGTFKGTVTLDGAAPTLMSPGKKGDANVKDAAICVADADIPNETLVHDSGTKGVANVFVYLQKAPAGYKAPDAPTKPVVLDQKACRFFPRAVVVRAGQPVNVLNDDDCLHNTHVISLGFEYNQAIKSKDRTGLNYKFPKGLRTPAKITCDLHPWMLAYQLPLEHPFGVVTDAKGNFEIPGLPAGDYEFTIWHEATGYVEKSYKVSVKAGGAVTAAIKLPAAKIK